MLLQVFRWSICTLENISVALSSSFNLSQKRANIKGGHLLACFFVAAAFVVAVV